MEKEFVDFVDLSPIAKEIFTLVDKMMWMYNTTELDITKEDIAYLLHKSVPSIKIGIRELKSIGYLETEHINDTKLRVGKAYGFKTVEKGEYRK